MQQVKNQKEDVTIALIKIRLGVKQNYLRLFVPLKVEVNNHIRDVTLKEDGTKTKNKNQGQNLTRPRSTMLNIIKEVSPGNVRKAMEKFADSPDFFVKRLKACNFL